MTYSRSTDTTKVSDYCEGCGFTESHDANCPIFDDEPEPDVCSHGRSFADICVECCPEDDDGSETGEDWCG